MSSALARAGYRAIDAGFVKRRFFRREPANGPPAYHLHLVVCSTWPIKNELLVRDWLVAHADVATAYADLKRRLAGNLSDWV